MLAQSSDGVGGDDLYHALADYEDISVSMATILKRDADNTLPDQWEAQILLRILMHCFVIYVSDAPDSIVKAMHMTPAHSLEKAIKLAKEIVNKEIPKIVAIPDGVAVIVTKE